MTFNDFSIRLRLPHAGETAILWPMKLRLDLLEHLTADDICKAAKESVHRFKPEPLLSKTGAGSLSSASIEERAKEVEHSKALTRKLQRRARRRGKLNGKRVDAR
jgi:hypothetical protein